MCHIFMNKEEFISHCIKKLKPWADLQLILCDPASIEEEKKNDFNKLISPFFYSTKESLIILLQLIQGFLINGNDDLSFYFSILEFLIPKIKEFLTSIDIYSIYHKTFNHILLWYYNHGLLDIETIVNIAKNDSDIFQYFCIEIKEYDEKIYESILSRHEDTELFLDIKNFKEKREARINETLVAKSIREDDIDEFQNLISSTNLKINSKIPYSLFEACISVNYMNDMPTLIEYASFFGSIKIFKYLLMQNADINSNIWGYAIHSQNYDIIHMIEDRHIEPFYCVQSAIRYYRYDLFEYFTETQNIEINRDCINRAILNFNLIVLIDPKLLGSLYDNPNLTSDGEGDWNPLICCTLKSYPVLTELLLLIPKIDTNILYKNEFATPLIISARNSCFENVKLLCEHPTTSINLSVFNRNALCIAAGVGDARSVKYLLNYNGPNSDIKKINLFIQYFNPFNWAITNNHSDIVEILYNSPLVNEKIRSCMVDFHVSVAINAVKYKSWNCLKFLIQSEDKNDFEKFANDFANGLENMDSGDAQYADKILKEEIERRKNEK